MTALPWWLYHWWIWPMSTSTHPTFSSGNQSAGPAVSQAASASLLKEVFRARVVLWKCTYVQHNFLTSVATCELFPFCWGWSSCSATQSTGESTLLFTRSRLQFWCRKYMLLKKKIFLNLLTTVGSWGWSYYEGNTCRPTVQCAALCRLPSAYGTQEKEANPCHPAHRSAAHSCPKCWAQSHGCYEPWWSSTKGK